MIVGVVGPTCVGKTSVSIALAQALSAEIVSVDSRQIYRETTIGTAKPTPDELAAITHHFIDERSLIDPMTAAQFAKDARARIDDIQSHGKALLLVGGSTLYLHALLFGLDDVPASDPDVRKRLKARLATEGLLRLVEELFEKDPVTHGRTDLANSRRVLRALEVAETTGMTLSSFHTGPAVSPIAAKTIVLDRERTDLYRRIDARVDAMIDAGLVDEVKGILDLGLSSDLQAMQTIGYREVCDFLSGATDHPTMVALIKRNTRRYAKRQLTWFRRYEGFGWLEVAEDESIDSICSRIIVS